MKIKIERDITAEVDSFEKAIDAWKDDTADAHMKKAYAADRKGLKNVLNLFKKGKLKEAYQVAWDLDTIVRDQIPDKVWKIWDEAENIAS